MGEPRKGYFDEMNPVNRRILDLYRQGLKHAEIAQRVGLSRTACSNRVFEARLCGLIPPKPKAVPVVKGRRGGLRRSVGEIPGWEIHRARLAEQYRQEFLKGMRNDVWDRSYDHADP